ncbi:helix-turn-helix domain-containing protein [Methanomethylophilus alvi]|uniref:helix-turn-helix domain-containing protein n=1 Tax=Methanomethylophilus alvi TaxID=1291540 RepID=UPI0037DCE47A
MVNYEHLVKELAQYESETPWIEFKENKADPEEIAQRISGLANSAALHRHQYGYMIWGVRDSDHALVGTSFRPWLTKKGNEDLINWLRRTMSDNADFWFEECIIGDSGSLS